MSEEQKIEEKPQEEEAPPPPPPPNPFTNPSLASDDVPMFLGDQTTADAGAGLHIDPRRYMDLTTDFTSTEAVIAAGGHLASLVAFKAVFEGLYMGLNTVDRKFLGKCMDFLKPKEAVQDIPPPIMIQFDGLKIEQI